MWLVASLFCMALTNTSRAAVLYVDDFTDGSVQLGSTGSLASDYTTGLSGVVGGSRYAYVQRTSASGTASLGMNVFPFVGYTFYTSSAQANGFGGLSYGYNNDLGLDLSDDIYTGLFLLDFYADEPGMSGTIRLTLYSATGTEAVTRDIANFIKNPKWELTEFSNVDLSNIQRIDLDWYGFSEAGADIEFTGFGISNNLPEPTSVSMILLGGILLRTLRKRKLS